nr:MAG TPA_asm: hypothetical protein [Caudoviricetes sp.]
MRSARSAFFQLIAFLHKPVQKQPQKIPSTFYHLCQIFLPDLQLSARHHLHLRPPDDLDHAAPARCLILSLHKKRRLHALHHDPGRIFLPVKIHPPILLFVCLHKIGQFRRKQLHDLCHAFYPLYLNTFVSAYVDPLPADHDHIAADRRRVRRPPLRIIYRPDRRPQLREQLHRLCDADPHRRRRQKSFSRFSLECHSHRSFFYDVLRTAFCRRPCAGCKAGFLSCRLMAKRQAISPSIFLFFRLIAISNVPAPQAVLVLHQRQRVPPLLLCCHPPASVAHVSASDSTCTAAHVLRQRARILCSHQASHLLYIDPVLGSHHLPVAQILLRPRRPALYIFHHQLPAEPVRKVRRVADRADALSALREIALLQCKLWLQPQIRDDAAAQHHHQLVVAPRLLLAVKADRAALCLLASVFRFPLAPLRKGSWRRSA